MNYRNTVVIDCFQENTDIDRPNWAIVAIDVIRATTTAITAVACGRRCFPVPSVQSALSLQGEFPQALLAGEISGEMPEQFEVNNSPAEISARLDVHRPLILLSSAGTRLIDAARNCDFVYLACFRNFASLATHLMAHHRNVALIGAGSQGEFREEDQICCAWIGHQLLDAGYAPENDRTRFIIDRWGTAAAQDCMCSNSVGYLRRSGQIRDLNFTLDHVNDLADIFMVRDAEVVALPNATTALSASVISKAIA